jgi:hypothetical protein
MIDHHGHLSSCLCCQYLRFCNVYTKYRQNIYNKAWQKQKPKALTFTLPFYPYQLREEKDSLPSPLVFCHLFLEEPLVFAFQDSVIVLYFSPVSLRPLRHSWICLIIIALCHEKILLDMIRVTATMVQKAWSIYWFDYFKSCARNL